MCFKNFILKEEYRPFAEIYDLDKIKPVGQAGSLKGEDEMVRRGFEYLKEIRKKFKYTKYLSFRKLQLLSLAKKHELNHNFARFINRHELKENKRIYSLAFPNSEPTIDDVRAIFREYRKYDSSTHKKVSEMTPEEIEKRRAYKKKHQPAHNYRRNQVRQLKKFLGIPKEELSPDEKEKKEKMFIEEITKISKDPGFISYCMRLDKENYEDIIQDTLEAALNQKGTYVPKASRNDLKPAKLKTWLISIARNKSLQQFKKQTTRKDIPTSDFHDDIFMNLYQEPEYEESGSNKKASDVILKCFDELTEQLKEILELVMNGSSYKEIAKILNQKYNKNYSEDYIKNRVYTARQNLADKIHKILPSLEIYGKTGIKK